MATSNNCTKNCGCTDTYVVTQPCPPSCAEVFNAQCIVYTGTDILCGQDTVIKRYDYLDTVITKLVNYFCTRLANVPVTVVESDSEYILVSSSTVGNTTTYVLDLDFAQLAADLNLTLPVYNVVGSENITVTTTTIGNTTTFNLQALETIITNTDNLLDITVNTLPGINIEYEVNIDVPALAALIPEAVVVPGPSNNSFITATTVGNLTTFAVDSKESIVAAGDNVTVTATGGGAPAYDTTYTVDAELSSVVLAGGETLLTLTSTYNPAAHLTTYTLETDLAVLDTIINAAINDVLDNTVSLFGIDAVYDNITQTLSIEFIGAAVDGTTMSGDGTAGNPLSAITATLTNAGVLVGNESLVNDGTGPSLATKGLNVGSGLTITSSATDIKLDTSFNKYESPTTAIGASATVSFTHNLGTLTPIVSVTQSPLPLPLAQYSQGVDYRVVVTGTNTIEITDLSGAGLGNVSVAVIG